MGDFGLVTISEPNLIHKAVMRITWGKGSTYAILSSFMEGQNKNLIKKLTASQFSILLGFNFIILCNCRLQISENINSCECLY